jgi:hypothetical protein
MSYLSDYVRKNSGGPSTADQLAEAEKRGRGNTSFAQHLREERAAELAAEKVNKDRIASLEKVLDADALEAEKYRVESILTQPETNPEEIRLNSYFDRVQDKKDTHNYTESDWKQLVQITMPTITEMLGFQGIELVGDEIDKIIRYLIANGIYLGDAEAYGRAFKALRNHGVIRVPVPVAAPAASAPAPSPFDIGRAEVESLRAEALTHKYGSREREHLERQAYALETKLEVLGNETYQQYMQEICTQAGLVLGSEHSMQFLNWLQSPKQVRRFDGSRTSVRIAFAEFFGNQSFLTAEEKELIGYNRQVEVMTSEDIKRSVGTRNTYSPHNDAYRANPMGRV